MSLGNHPAVAANDQVSFWAEIFNAVGGLGNGSGIFRSLGTGVVTRIVRTGEIPPIGSSFFDGFSWPSTNSSGEVAFLGLLDSGPEGIYRGTGGALTTIALEGDEIFPGWEIRDFTPVEGVPINEEGSVAFRVRVDDPNTDAIALGSGGVLERVAYGGQIPDAGQPGAVPFVINRNVALNDNNQVAFMAQQLNAFSGIFRAEPGFLVAIAREDGPVPGTASGTFESISGNDFALNRRGDVAFVARFQVGGEFQDGLFIYTDETGLLPAVVQEGSVLAGGIVDSISFVGVNPFEFRAGEPTGLDDQGRVVFRFGLTNGLDGIAVFHLPPIFEDGFESGDTSAWSAVSP